MALLLFLKTVGILCTALSSIITLQAYLAYRYTGRSYLLNFISGFLLIGFSYSLETIGLQNATNQLSEVVEWPFLIVQLVAISLIASSYFFSQDTETNGTKHRHGEIIVLVALLLTVAVCLPIVVWLLLPVISPEYVDEYFFLTNTVLSVYVFVKPLRSYVQARTRSSALVVSGFGLFCVSEYTWLIWSIDGGTASFLSANLLQLTSLCLFATAFLPYKEEHF